MSDADAASIASDEFDDSMNVGNLSSASAAAAASYKGKGKLRTSAHDVEFKVLGPQDIKKAQLNAIDYVSDLTSLKVRSLALLTPAAFADMLVHRNLTLRRCCVTSSGTRTV